MKLERASKICGQIPELPPNPHRDEVAMRVWSLPLRYGGSVAVTFIIFFKSLLFAVEPGSFHADGKRGKNAIALTFDDGPRLFTERVLDILGQYKVKATFFMNGDQVKIRPDLAREVQKRGHEIGEHTWSHVNFFAYEKKNGAEKTKEKVREEMSLSKDIFQKTLGMAPTICRMPNGYTRPWLKAIAKDFGYALVNWTFGEDWTPASEDKMTKDYLAHVQPGAILLFHDGGKNRTKTIKILPQVIQEAQSKGLAIQTVSQILE